MFCFLAVQGHAADCTTQGTLNITCSHPNVLSNVSLVVDGITKYSKESRTGVTIFSVPYPDIVNASVICRVNHRGIHNSSNFTVEQGRQLFGLVFIALTTP